jgi:hypothetical protein
VLTSVHGKPVNYGQTIQLRHVRSVAMAPVERVKSHPHLSLLLAAHQFVHSVPAGVLLSTCLVGVQNFETRTWALAPRSWLHSSVIEVGCIASPTAALRCGSLALLWSRSLSKLKRTSELAELLVHLWQLIYIFSFRWHYGTRPCSR